MLKSYDPNHSFGTHTVRVTLMEWDYSGSFDFKVGGNVKGLGVMHDISSLLEDTDIIDSDCDFKIIEDDEGNLWYQANLKNETGDVMQTEDYLDELENIIVKVEIIDFVKQE